MDPHADQPDHTAHDTRITTALADYVAGNLGDRPEAIAKFFAYAHLPEKLRAVSRAFATLAVETILALPASAERTVALRKLLESKDAAVRAAL